MQIDLTFVDIDQSKVDTWNEINPTIPAICGDYFSANTQAVTSPGNSFGFMDGSLDLVISERVGWKVQEHLQDIIQNYVFNHELLVGQACCIWIEETDFEKAVICAPTMTAPMKIIDPYDVYLATRAAVRCAMEEGVTSLTLPAMGMGAGGVDPVKGMKIMGIGIRDAIRPPPYPKTWHEASQRRERISNV